MLLLLLALAAGVGAAARALGREIPRPHLALFLFLAVLPFPRAFLTHRTPVPLDHAMYTLPWMPPGQPPPYNPNLNDIATEILPWTKAVRMAWKEGSLPLWNRWNGCGMPLAANSVSTAFSPLTLATVFWPLVQALTLAGAIKILLAAAGTWLWVREIGASSRAAAFAAVAFALSFSFTPPWLYFPHSTPLCLWPWTLFLIERCRDERGRGRTVIALTLVFAFTALAGHPETAVICFLFAALWIALRWATSERTRPGRLLSAVALAASIAVALTAFLLVPSLFAIAGSGRIAAVGRPYWEPILSLRPHGPQWRALPTAFFPHTLGNGVGSPMLPPSGGSFPETGLGYFGIVGWSAALLIVRPGSPRRRVEWVLATLLLCGLGVAVGQWPVAEIFAKLPGIGFLFPIRFHSWVALSGVGLAALELDRLAQDLDSRSPFALAAAGIPLALALAAGLVFLRFSAEHAAAGGRAFQTRQLTVVLAVLAATVALTVAARKRSDILIAGLAVLCAGELLCQWRFISKPLYSPADLFPDTPLIRFLRRQPGPFRVVGEGPVLFPNSNVFAGLEDIRTHDAVERHDYLAFLDATCGYPYEYFKILRNLDAPALDFLNVRYVLTGPGGRAPGRRWRLVYEGPDGRVFENANALPRVFTPERVRLVRAPATVSEPAADANALFGSAFRDITANRDWRRTAWVLAGRAEETPGGTAEISDYRGDTNTVAFSARVPENEAWLVLSLVQDGGWSARDEAGNAVAVLRANGPFLALKLPAGDHRIRLRYRPPGFSAGLTISALAAAAAIGAVATGARRGRGTRATPVSG